MRTPALAVLWESWRLSRRYLAVIVFLAVFGGAALIVSPMDSGWSARFALGLAAYLAFIGQTWANNVDSRKGFSLALGFVRPIPTWVLVSVPMAYVGITCAMVYLVPVLILRAAFGISFPLLPVAAAVGTLSLVGVSSNWWTQNAGVRALRFGLAAVLVLLWLWFGSPTVGNELSPDRWPELFAFSAQAYGMIALIAVAAIGVTIVGVDRQRRGDDEVTLAMPTRRGANAQTRAAFRTWIADRLRVQCPTSSPTRAQLWYETYTVGGRVLATGLLTALAAPPVLTIRDAAGRTGSGGMLAFLASLAFLPPLIVGLRSLLGVRRKQGVSYLSAFTSARAIGTGRLIGLKVLVTWMALLGAWSAIGISLWFFAIQLGVWGPEVADSEYATDFLGLFEQPPIIALVLVWAVVVVAAAGAIRALFLLNAKRVLLTGLGLTIYITSLVVIAGRGRVGETAMTALALVLPAAVLLATIYHLFRRALAERIFTPRGFSGVMMIWLVLVFAFAQGWRDDITEWDDVVTLAFLALMPLWILTLTLWSFSRLRHR